LSDETGIFLKKSMKKKINQPANPVAMGIGLITRRMK
jgi:hypothetical protein